MFRNGLVFRFIGVLLLIGLIAAGGVMAYQAGVVQGVAQAPTVATAIAQSAENGQGAPVPPLMYGQGYGYGYYPMYGHHFGFFPFGVCGSILLVFFFFGLLRMLFFRPWHSGWGGHRHGPWGKHWEGGAPSMFDEWHKRAHGESTPSDSEATKTDS